MSSSADSEVIPAEASAENRDADSRASPQDPADACTPRSLRITLMKRALARRQGVSRALRSASWKR
jgi:hypothetical protein